MFSVKFILAIDEMAIWTDFSENSDDLKSELGSRGGLSEFPGSSEEVIQ